MPEKRRCLWVRRKIQHQLLYEDQVIGVLMDEYKVVKDGEVLLNDGEQ